MAARVGGTGNPKRCRVTFRLLPKTSTDKIQKSCCASGCLTLQQEKWGGL